MSIYESKQWVCLSNLSVYINCVYAREGQSNDSRLSAYQWPYFMSSKKLAFNSHAEGMLMKTELKKSDVRLFVEFCLTYFIV